MLLSERLKDWQDFDVASYNLGVVLGLFEDVELSECIFNKAPKWIFWTNNPMGTMFSNMLNQLLEVGILESNNDQQFRWDSNRVEEYKKEFKMSERKIS